MIDEYAFDAAPEDKSALYDVPLITAILQEVAAEERWISYSEMLMRLGFRFTRPKMRVLCKTLETVDAEANARGEPPLAVLVVRESDGLPGQGWWVGRRDYDGQWTGSEARAFIHKHQDKAFRYWKARR
jgi:hypothetical protein